MAASFGRWDLSKTVCGSASRSPPRLGSGLGRPGAVLVRARESATFRSHDGSFVSFTNG